MSGVSILHVLSAVCEVSRRDGHRHALKHAPKHALLAMQVVAGCKWLAGAKRGVEGSSVEVSWVTGHLFNCGERHKS